MNVKFNLVVFVFLFTAVSFISFYLTRNGYLAIALHWMKNLGWQGVIVLLLFFVVLSFPLPMGSTPLLLAAGFLYGFKLGLAAVTLGTFIGGNLAFFVCRKLLKKCVSVRVHQSPALMAILKAVEDHAFKVCFMVRMTPLPFGIQNGLFAISKIGFKVYVVASLLGLIPEQMMLVYIGSTTKQLTEIIEGKVQYGSLEKFLFGTQVIVCITIIVGMVYVGRRALREAIKDNNSSTEATLEEIPLSLNYG